MKKIEAIIRSSKFEPVKTALSEIGANFFTFSEVKGFGKQAGEHVVYRGAEYDLGYIARLKIEVVVTDDNAEKVAATIRKAAHTGEIGDGKILIIGIDEIISVRTAKVNESAL
ncbi:MAG: P-II family nitrogen regulator [Saprospiraceae bacterium]|nr:P-II family nitrogen regulator [Saprospiraceae bacterium]MBK8392060.1 P-II family nitrogen regulator [Saprospiraceae bacterium]MBK8635584.1 P-II family nitrogen regulator [Saprospiraceae bacterium]MBP7643227.1 P-II family nitrogen regulator [Saprospiraceae bacterium]HMS69534.1 P-II family nitrogen regulator [Saprospiraceae bacterium]